MFGSKCITVFLVSTILQFCESVFVENLPKCEINDGDCEKDLFQFVLRHISKNGISELDIPDIDPIELRNMSFSILDMLDLTLVEGNLKGIKNCKVEKYFTDVENEFGFMEMFCDSLTLKGQYKAFASNPLVKTLLGGESVNGDGNFKVNIDKLHLRFDYEFYIQQRAGDIYVKTKRDKSIHKYDIGKLTFFVDNLHLGTEDASVMVTSLLNKNWRPLMTTFGKTFIDRAMEIVYDFIDHFFDTVPCKYYILNDLTEYARP